MADPPLRLEDVARLVDASRATLYYFSGRDDLLGFLLTAHTRAGSAAMRAAVRDREPAEQCLAAMVGALVEFLGVHPGTCAGLLSALGATGRMTEVLRESDTWIAGPLREVLAEGVDGGSVAVIDPADAANAVVGAVLLGVLGRSMAAGDPTDPAFREALIGQVLRGVLAGVPAR